MDQIHRRFNSDQVKHLLRAYLEGLMDRTTLEETLGVNRSRFFALVKNYRRDPETFSIDYCRASPSRLPCRTEKVLHHELLREKTLVENRQLPISSYNYSALRDRLQRQGLDVSLPTIIDRAKRWDCYKSRPKKKIHDREVITTAPGALIQHDASHHLWSPYADRKWALISSLDDYSRKILFADFFEAETSWAHIQAAQALFHRFGLPFRYYVDSLRVFRYVHKRDSFWYNTVLKTDEADPQWKQVLKILGVEIIYALSPQAKGKIERSYRWLQDRTVRTAALEKLSTLDDVRAVLQDEVYRYNYRQVHSTTGEIPQVRFERARRNGQSMFRPFVLPQPYTSFKDIFCLRESRSVNAYRRIELFGKEFRVLKVPIGQRVEIHMIPDPTRQVMEVRFWWNNQTVQSFVHPLKDFPRVHF